MRRRRRRAREGRRARAVYSCYRSTRTYSLRVIQSLIDRLRPRRRTTRRPSRDDDRSKSGVHHARGQPSLPAGAGGRPGRCVARGVSPRWGATPRRVQVGTTPAADRPVRFIRGRRSVSSPFHPRRKMNRAARRSPSASSFVRRPRGRRGARRGGGRPEGTGEAPAPKNAHSARVSAVAPEATPRADSRIQTRAKIASAEGPTFESPWSGPSCRCRARRFRTRRNPRLRIRPSLPSLRRRFPRRRRRPSAPGPSPRLCPSLSPSARRAGLASPPAPPPPPLEESPEESQPEESRREKPPPRPRTRTTSSPTPTDRRWAAPPRQEPRWRAATREVAPPIRPSSP